MFGNIIPMWLHFRSILTNWWAICVSVGPKTVQEKTKWALDTGLAGIMVWECGQDSFAPDKSLLGFIAAAAKQWRSASV